MRNVTRDKHLCIQWTISLMLEDLDFGDDFGLLSHRHQDIQQKTKDLCETASKIGLRVYIWKTQALRTNTTNTNAITGEEKPLEQSHEFIYLGSKITADGDGIGESKARISKASQAFALLRPIWKTPNISTHTKIRIFRSNVLSVLLYGAECWRMTKSLEYRLEVFQNKFLRRILKIFWPNIISNEDLRGRTGLEPLNTIF
ncbi:endonuclease-reverse transcriptase [Elysia marginata]|uniref:Endonuclease-reverse transcriptase n=1 Tax=Elysia marginata TaxID=1093978 RepID=A0AAV4HJL0_9GAST|nr:endonuclease-reverse transcriptase [Elysia marginata]